MCKYACIRSRIQGQDLCCWRHFGSTVFFFFARLWCRAARAVGCRVLGRNPVFFPRGFFRRQSLRATISPCPVCFGLFFWLSLSFSCCPMRLLFSFTLFGPPYLFRHLSLLRPTRRPNKPPGAANRAELREQVARQEREIALLKAQVAEGGGGPDGEGGSRVEVLEVSHVDRFLFFLQGLVLWRMYTFVCVALGFGSMKTSKMRIGDVENRFCFCFCLVSRSMPLLPGEHRNMEGQGRVIARAQAGPPTICVCILRVVLLPEFGSAFSGGGCRSRGPQHYF